MDPFLSADLSSEDVIYHGMQALDTRDFIVPTTGTPNEAFKVFIAGPGVNVVTVDVKAKRRVRSEDDRLILSARAGEVFSQSTPPLGPNFLDVGARVLWGLRFLYRTHR